MSMPFYVSPEQLMKDRADFARKGISRGRGLVVVRYADGLLFCSENTSPSLHKISELYDRLAFAAVGRYNEFENLRIAGVRLADMRGYSYDRRDVTGRGLANAYAQTLGTIFSSGAEKPYEVEIFVAEVGNTSEEDQIYRLTYDGSVADVRGFAVMGGTVEPVAEYLEQHYTEGLDFESALRLAVEALGHDGTTVRSVDGDHLEVAVLDRTRTQPRKFRRIPKSQLNRLLGAPPTDPDSSTEAAGAAVSTSPTDGGDVTDGEEAGVSTSSTDDAGSADGVGATDAADPSDLVGELPDEPDGAKDE